MEAVMGTNEYLRRQKAIKDAYFEAGLRCGRQQILDMVSLVLRDPDIMGKDTFGGQRLIKVVQGVGDYIDTYQKAWEMDDETDYYRAKLDEALAQAYGESLHDSFLKRYEFAPEYDYFKGRWK
jgi:hypothetical protein